jgi:orotidine-5'-phosphate decarboxylase
MTKLIVALDTADVDRAINLINMCAPFADMFKVRLPLLLAVGARYDEVFHGVDVMMDLKLHDIPSSVIQDVKALLPYRPKIITVFGRDKAISTARSVVDHLSVDADRPLIAAVMMLTSNIFGADRLPVDIMATRLVRDGADCIVSPAIALPSLRAALGDTVKLISPGIRTIGSPADDQQGVVTPAEAARLGADWIVVGRSITRAENPGWAASSIRDDLEIAANALRLAIS